MHRTSGPARPTSFSSARPGSATAVDAGFVFVDMHVRGREADLTRAASASPRSVTIDDIRPERATTLAEVEALLGANTHVLVQSHGVGSISSDGTTSSEPQLARDFVLDARTATPMPHLRFVMLLACFQGFHEDAWRRFAPNATIVLSERAVHPRSFSPVAVDIVADFLLDARLPSSARTHELLRDHQVNHQWGVHVPAPDVAHGADRHDRGVS